VLGCPMRSGPPRAVGQTGSSQLSWYGKTSIRARVFAKIPAGVPVQVAYGRMVHHCRCRCFGQGSEEEHRAASGRPQDHQVPSPDVRALVVNRFRRASGSGRTGGLKAMIGLPWV
jgi:hypothetical protein